MVMINMYIYTGFQKIYNLSIFSFSIKKVEPELVKGKRSLHVSTMTALFHLRTVARTELLLRCEMLMPSPSPFWWEKKRYTYLICIFKKQLFQKLVNIVLGWQFIPSPLAFLFKPFFSHEWPRWNFSLQYQ